MLFAEKQTLNLFKNICACIAYLDSISLKENCISLCHLKVLKNDFIVLI